MIGFSVSFGGAEARVGRGRPKVREDACYRQVKKRESQSFEID
jgi:hypothetical protein